MSWKEKKSNLFIHDFPIAIRIEIVGAKSFLPWRKVLDKIAMHANSYAKILQDKLEENIWIKGYLLELRVQFYIFHEYFKELWFF